MESQGKVTKLVTRFNNKTYVKRTPPKVSPHTPVKEKKQPAPIIDKKSLDEDEISVTIDIGDVEETTPGTKKPQIKTRSKKSLPLQDNDASEPPNQSNAPKSESSNQINPSLTAKGSVKGNPSQLSPWLSDRINNVSAEVQNSKQRTIATDTFELDRLRDEEIRLLKETLDDFECQTKIKDREIETLKWIENEMQKRLQTTGDILSLKHQVKELQRNLDLQERLNHDLTKDNARIYEEMSYKDRKIMELQSEVNNLDRIVASKTYFEDTDNNQKNLDRIDNLQRDLLEKEIEVKECEQKINSLIRELDMKDKELSIKNMKLDDYILENSHFQQEILLQEKNHYDLIESLKLKEKENEMLFQNVKKVDDFERKWESLEDENLFLKQSLLELENQCKELERRQSMSQDMSSVLEDLRLAISEKNHLSDENNRLSEQLRITESMLKEKRLEEISLIKENNQLKTFIENLEEENGLYRKFESDVNDLDAELRESEKARNALENQIVQLKPEIQRLQVKSLEKDHLILQLAQELKSRVGYLPSDLRKEISKNDSQLGDNTDKDIPTREKFV